MPVRQQVGWTWDARLGRYRSPSGRFTTREGIRNALDDALDNAGRRANALAEQFRRREISVQVWTRGMRDIVTETQLYSAAAAKGGWSQLVAADVDTISSAIARQYGFLDGFVQQIEAGQVPMDGRFLNRVKLYPQAARSLFHAMDSDDEQARGKTEELNVLHLSDHCSGDGDGCLEQTSIGWVPIGTLVPIGERLCKVNCKCTIQYR